MEEKVNMLVLVAKRKLYPLYLVSRYCSASAAIQYPTSASDPKPSHFVLADHLITTWGFSPDKAATISNRLTHLKSPENPDAVLRFLTNHGFTDPQIKTLVSWCPKLLQSSPQNTLDRNLRDLHDIGLSPSAVTRLILTSPAALHLDSAVPRIKFWQDFLGGDEATLIKAFRRNIGLVKHDSSHNFATKISLLRSRGFTTNEIRKILVKVPRFITSSVTAMEGFLERAGELGFQRESRVFMSGLQAVTSVTREALQKKMEIMMSFGWSRDEFLSAMRKCPSMVTLSEENLRVKMDFLLGKAGCDPSYISSNPALLSYSLEKRLRPRHYVLHLIESKGLSGRRKGFSHAIYLVDRQFVEKYILPYQKEIPGLHEAYLDACASGSRSSFLKYD